MPKLAAVPGAAVRNRFLSLDASTGITTVMTRMPAVCSGAPCNARRRLSVGGFMPRRTRNGNSATPARRWWHALVAGSEPRRSGSASATLPSRTAVTSPSLSPCRTHCGLCLRPTHGFVANWLESAPESSGAMPECAKALKSVSCQFRKPLTEIGV